MRQERTPFNLSWPWESNVVCTNVNDVSDWNSCLILVECLTKNIFAHLDNNQARNVGKNLLIGWGFSYFCKIDRMISFTIFLHLSWIFTHGTIMNLIAVFIRVHCHCFLLMSRYPIEISRFVKFVTHNTRERVTITMYKNLTWFFRAKPGML